ncbi:MAG: protein-L-isoaspartate O-methyltransferase [Rhizobiales bacterium]|nr:protein-L-isoaspartate O-methyltransferase [Hyphomicrobiales bacterium]
MTDDFSALRTRMVDCQLRTTDVTAPEILDAMGSVPREEFVPAARRALAYIDEDIELTAGAAGKGGRFLMEPSPFARLLQLAEIGPDDRVLDVGCASGYSAAVLSRIAASVVALEEDAALAESARAALARLGCAAATVVTGPLAAGYPQGAPYDVIVIEGAVDEVPPALFGQLQDAGRLVAVEGHGNAGIAKVYLKTGGVVSGRRAFNAAIRPLPGFERAAVFEF